MVTKGDDKMDIADIVRKYHNLDSKVVINNQSSTFQSKIDSRLSLFNLSIKDFKIADKYEFSEETTELIIKIHEFNLKQYANRLSKDDLQKINSEDFYEFTSLVEKLIKSHFKDESQLRDMLLKVYVVETEVGIFDEEVLKSLNLLRALDPKIKARALNDLRLLFLEPFSKIKYPNLSDEDRHDLFIEFIGNFESEVYDFMDRVKEREVARIENKGMTTQELKDFILGDY